jgi:hypothetical protein
MSHWDQLEEERLIEELEHAIRVLLYIRNIGAEHLLVFCEKIDSFCSEHWEYEIRESGMATIRPFLRDLAAQLAKEGNSSITGYDPRKKRARYRFKHPNMVSVHTGSVSWKKGPLNSPRLRDAVARSVVDRYMRFLVVDIATARSIDSPLAATVQLHGEMLRALGPKPTIADVAYRLELSVLSGVHPEILIKVRQDEKEYFEAFRTNLRLAIKQRLASAEIERRRNRSRNQGRRHSASIKRDREEVESCK